MQPNGQDPNQQPPVVPAQPLPYAVPEYLHLDPVTGQQRTRRGFRTTLLITAVTILLVSVAVSAIIWLRHVSERRLNAALENLATVKYVERTMTFSSTTQNLSINAESDFSDIDNPKSTLNFVYSIMSPVLGPGMVSTKSTIAVNQVIVNDITFMEQVKNINNASRGDTLKKGQWYKVSDNSKNFQNDLAISRNFVNIPLLLFPIGDFSQAQRQSIMQLIGSEKAYTIKSVKNEEVKGERISVYTINLSKDEMKKLYESLTYTLASDQISQALSLIENYGSLEIWVDNNGQITKMASSPATTGTSGSSLEIDYKYPVEFNITVPDNVEDVPQGLMGILSIK